MKDFFMLKMNMLFCCLLFFASCGREETESLASIGSITSYQEIESTFDALDDQALCVFDVDDTLIYNRDPILKALYDGSWKMQLVLLTFFPFHPRRFFDEQYKRNLISIIFNTVQFYSIESEMVERIKRLQDRGVRCIALTSMETGRMGVIPSMEEWRYNHLKELGFDFSFDRARPTIWYDDKEFGSRKPLFYRGILCAEHHLKGAVLKSYLQKIGLTPSRILFFDDRKKQVVSVKQEMDAIGIPCNSFVYGGARARHPEGFDFWEMRRRVAHLIDYEEWLPAV